MGRERERRSRSRERSRERRHRSRSRERSRRSRSREKGRSSHAEGGTSSSYDTNLQAVLALQQQQQELQRQQMLQSLLLQQQALANIPGVTIGAGGVAGGVGGAPNPATKKAREVYVGNLAVGVIGANEVRELFNAVFANFVPNPVTEPPVLEIKMDSSGRFCFMELRTLELADHMITLDKMEVCGRPLKIGRPKGYEEEAAKLQSQQKLSMAQTFAAQLSGGPTNVVLLENLAPARNMTNPVERREIFDDVFTESVSCGPVAGVAVPVPSEQLTEDVPCRVYVKYHNVEDAKKCKEMMDGRTFDERTVKASFSNDFDFSRAQQGEWLSAAPAMQQVSALPGPPVIPGITGLPGLGGVLPGATATIPGLPPGTVIPVLQPPGAAGAPVGLAPPIVLPDFLKAAGFSIGPAS